MAMAMASAVGLLLHHRDPHLGPDLGMNLDTDLEIAELPNRLVQIDLALVDMDAELLELALDVARGDRAVQLLLFAYFDRERQLNVGEFGRFALGSRFLGGELPGEALALVGDFLLVRFGRRIGEALGEEVIAGVAILHLHDFADLPQVLHVSAQNDFHRPYFLGLCWASASRRRYWYQVSVMPSVQSPGRRKSNGTASAAAAAAKITSITLETPNASANVMTIAAPRST